VIKVAVAVESKVDREVALEPELSVPLWGELLWPWERVVSLFSPTTWGFRAPRGDGSAVVLVPGFMGTDNYLARMYWWLWLIGYTPVMSGIGINARCPNLLCNRLEKTIVETYEETGSKVTIIGHSLGGTLARVVSAKRPNMVERVIMLASPIRPIDSAIKLNPVTSGISKLVRFLQSGEGTYPDCLKPNCGCSAMSVLRRISRSPAKETAIYTRSDGIVDWRNTVFGNPDVDIEVKGPHMALPYNPQVYRVIADILSGNGINERAVA
jgi:pimeloyl-ACP methyl ester carboxylesterase